MKRLLTAVAFALAASLAQAEPLVYTDTTWSTNGFADAGGVPASGNDGSPVTPLPLLTSAPATSSDGLSTASADAIADTNLLSALATAVVASPDFGASAVASASFLGNFIAPGGILALFLDIDTSGTSTQGGGTGDGAVRVTVVANGGSLIDEILRITGIYQRYIDLPLGTPGFVNIEAIGSADAVALGDVAAGSAIVTFGVNRVPEPAGWMLVAATALIAFWASPVARRVS